ncbi:MAG TPA: glycosyltransferase family 4 protein [Chthoniobacteraceae bacterium]|jgi:glycosyltransferase involved in cell wall biosynthesis
MRVLFLNQYFPPDPAPTGVLFRELADRLTAEGHDVDFISARQDYREGQGKSGRLRREILALFRMLIDGLRSRHADVVISGTSPPCLAFVAALVALRHRAAHFHWVMDLYPEIAVALGELPPGFLASTIGGLLGWSYRRAAKVVALDADMAARLTRRRVSAECLRPWVFAPVLATRDALLGEAAASVQPSTDEPWTWIYSGNLGRAHEWETLLEAQALLERRDPEIRLLFQGGGPSWPAAQARAKELGLARCDWLPYIEEAELPASLLRCQALVVTQRPDIQGLLWPSKLGLVSSLPRPILWVGPKEGAIANLLRELPSAGIFAPGKSDEVAAWILATKRREADPNLKALDPRQYREAALERWVKLLG